MTQPPGGRSVLILLAACATLVLASCGDGGEVVRPTPAAAASESGTTGDSPLAPEDESPMDLEEAAGVAVKAVGGSSLLTIETAPGRTIWEATVVTRDGTEHEMLIAMSDGSLVDGPTRKADDAEDKADNRALVAGAELDYREAVRAIADVVGGAKLMELNLDTFEDRQTTWEGDLFPTDGIRYTVTIDAKSGEVLEKDADAEDND
jgi:uncharacterized membrane protein YkoI